jgi:hypothetical protein
VNYLLNLMRTRVRNRVLGAGGFWDGVVLFNFSDSNSDTSSVAAVMGIHIAPPEGRASFQRPMGWLSDDSVILNLI